MKFLLHRSVWLAFAVCLITLVAGLLLLSLLQSRGILPEEKVSLAVPLLYGISTWCGMLNVKRIRRPPALIAATLSVLLTGTALLCSLIIGERELVLGRLLMCMGAMLTGGLLGGMIRPKQKKKHAARGKTPVHRKAVL